MALGLCVFGSLLIQASAISFIGQSGSIDMSTHNASLPLYAPMPGSLFCSILVLPQGGVNETLHGFHDLELWLYTFEGGGFMHTTDPAAPNFAMPVGSQIFIHAGYLYAYMHPAGAPVTKALGCLATNTSLDYGPASMMASYFFTMNDTLPVEMPTAPYAKSFFDSATSSYVDLDHLSAPMLGENAVAHPLVTDSAIGSMSIFAITLATAQTYQYHANHSLIVVNVRGQHVQASSDADELAMIEVPEGSVMKVEPGENYKFVNGDEAAPAELVFVFNPGQVVHTQAAEGAGKMACSSLKSQYKSQSCCQKNRRL